MMSTSADTISDNMRELKICMDLINDQEFSTMDEEEIKSIHSQLMDWPEVSKESTAQVEKSVAELKTHLSKNKQFSAVSQ